MPTPLNTTMHSRAVETTMRELQQTFSQLDGLPVDAQAWYDITCALERLTASVHITVEEHYIGKPIIDKPIQT